MAFYGNVADPDFLFQDSYPTLLIPLIPNKTLQFPLDASKWRYNYTIIKSSHILIFFHYKHTVLVGGEFENGRNWQTPEPLEAGRGGMGEVWKAKLYCVLWVLEL